MGLTGTIVSFAIVELICGTYSNNSILRPDHFRFSKEYVKAKQILLVCGR